MIYKSFGLREILELQENGRGSLPFPPILRSSRLLPGPCNGSGQDDGPVLEPGTIIPHDTFCLADGAELLKLYAGGSSSTCTLAHCHSVRSPMACQIFSPTLNSGAWTETCTVQVGLLTNTLAGERGWLLPTPFTERQHVLDGNCCGTGYDSCWRMTPRVMSSMLKLFRIERIARPSGACRVAVGSATFGII